MVVLDSLSITTALVSILLAVRRRRWEYLLGLSAVSPILLGPVLVVLFLLVYALMSLRRVFPREGVGTLLSLISFLLFAAKFHSVLIHSDPTALVGLDSGFMFALLSSGLFFSLVDVRARFVSAPVPILTVYVLLRLSQVLSGLPLLPILVGLLILSYRQRVKELFWASIILVLALGESLLWILGLVGLALVVYKRDWAEFPLATLLFYWWWLR